MSPKPKCKRTGKLKSPTTTGRTCKKKTGPKKSPKKVLKKSPKCKDKGKLKEPTETGRVCKKKPGPKKSPKTVKKSPKTVKKSPKIVKKSTGGTKETQFYCVKCKDKVIVQPKDIYFLTKTAKGRTVNMLKGKHSVCGVQCHKIVSKDSVPDLKKKYKTCK